MASQVEELLRSVDDARQARQRECVRLLLKMTPRLQAAKSVERQLDRHLARRFNVFKYLRKNEIGLSRVIADMLDPRAEHGQGTSFLKAMLDAFPETHGRFGRLRATAANSIKVATERWTTTGRRIDITVDIPSETGRYCLAFENKPYAIDQDSQVKAYLDYLGEQYETRFLLVYLPPVHREPDEASLPQVDRKRWQGHFRVMPYTGGDASLEGWLATCRKLCGADRVRWFLRDAELFCQQRFGESNMMTNPDTRFVREYLIRQPEPPACHARHTRRVASRAGGSLRAVSGSPARQRGGPAEKRTVRIRGRLPCEVPLPKGEEASQRPVDLSRRLGAVR